MKNVIYDKDGKISHISDIDKKYGDGYCGAGFGIGFIIVILIYLIFFIVCIFS